MQRFHGRVFLFLFHIFVLPIMNHYEHATHLLAEGKIEVKRKKKGNLYDILYQKTELYICVRMLL